MKPYVAVIAAVVALALAGAGAWSVWAAAAPEPIAIGNMLNEYSGLIFIADEQGFFARNGLNATFTTYVATVASVGGLENGDTDVAVMTEFTIVTEALAGRNISVIGNIDRYQAVFLLGRKDRGIADISDLRGRRIGVSRNTIGEFYLSRFLELHDIPTTSVTLVNVPGGQYVDAITNGSVDAIVVVQRYLDESRRQLGDAQVSWPIQNGQQGYLVLACRNDWAAGHPATIEKVLRSLSLAEEYAVTHPSEARAIVQRRFNYTDEYMATVWPDHQFGLSLDQAFVAAMEDESRWMIANNLTNQRASPDFLRYVSPAGLKRVRPDSVHLIAERRGP